MDIHKPKAAHSIREFLIEIGTIICGILIALGLEQAVEAAHAHHKVEAAEHAMRMELSDDDGLQAYARATITGCLDNQLGSIIAALDTGRDRSAITLMTDNYRPPSPSWDRQTWDAAVASDLGSHIGAQQLNQWSRVFDLIPKFNFSTAKEADDIELLTIGVVGTAPLPPEQADRIARAAKSLRRLNSQMNRLSLLILHWLEPLHAQPAKSAEAAVLADARQKYGTCAAPPDSNKISHAL